MEINPPSTQVASLVMVVFHSNRKATNIEIGTKLIEHCCARPDRVVWKRDAMEGLTLKRSWRDPVSKNMGKICDADLWPPHVHTWASAPTHMVGHTQLRTTVEKETKRCLKTLASYVVVKEKSNIVDFVDNCRFKKRLDVCITQNLMLVS